MFLIGEFSKITKVSVRMLRYYDKNDLFKPRMKDDWTGYRYYTADQIDELYRILQLRDSGFGINEIAECIQITDQEEMLLKLSAKKKEIEGEIEKARFQLSRLEALTSDLKDKSSFMVPEATIVMKSIATKEIYSLRRKMRDYYEEGKLWEEIMQVLYPLGYDDKSEGFTLYHDEDEREENVDMEICVVVDGKSRAKEVPKGILHRQVEGVENAASIMVYGPYENISKAYKKFAYWLEKHQEYEMFGPTRQICHVGGCNTKDETKFITELLVPLRLRK